jgi:hypothetical protein
MITVARQARILIASRPVDFRRGMDGLAATVQQVPSARTPITIRPDHRRAAAHIEPALLFNRYSQRRTRVL